MNLKTTPCITPDYALLMKDDFFKNFRKDDEPPVSVSNWGWKYHHIGIPTKSKMPDEVYIPKFRLYVSGFSSSPFGIEWMRYEKDSPVSKLIQSVPHIAFEVEDLEYELTEHDLNILNGACNMGS